ncbi:MAG: hypothetical protein WD768_07410 [Phycisphaeraceae bacterium]
MSANVIATCFALIAFTGSIIVGIAAGNTALTTLYRSVVAMFVCLFIGKVVGYVGQRSIETSIEEYKLAHPIPSDPMKTPDEASDEQVALPEAEVGETKQTHQRSAA